MHVFDVQHEVQLSVCAIGVQPHLRIAHSGDWHAFAVLEVNHVQFARKSKNAVRRSETARCNVAVVDHVFHVYVRRFSDMLCGDVINKITVFRCVLLHFLVVQL